MTKVTMTVNGRAVSGEVEGRTLLSAFLREGLGLTAPMWAAIRPSAAPVSCMWTARR